ncbi:MAG: FKBP-type peptidyl-prolyl cis-trans isomerase [bacterium]|nr:FKBP-type peptidyl-prolyl cis-trans isomerase [bacterium]
MDKSYFLRLLGAGVVVAALFYGAYYFENHTDLSKYSAKFADNNIPENSTTTQAEASTSTDIGSLFDKNPMASTTTPQGSLKIEDEKVGTGVEAKAGDSITVNYLGTILDGTKFDSSYDRGTPFTLTLGAGQVIKGWDQGLLGMKVGGKRKLTIPSDLAYGAQSPSPAIPANSTLVFEVELLKIEVGK